MKKSDFQLLVASVRQAGRIKRGEMEPARMLEVRLLTESLLSPPSSVGPYRHTDYLTLPDEPRCELIFGRFYATPSPHVPHQLVNLMLTRRLDDIAQESGGLVLCAPIDVQLADHSTVQPDILYLTAEHKARARQTVEGAPDLIVEVTSPSSARIDRDEKLRLYVDAGVPEYWIVDPAARQISFLVNPAGRFEVALDLDGVYRSEILPELTLDVAGLWRDLEARLPAS
jgi:Uma2 family endonuclease